jgi:predicted house-cleaning noncanonical NTP pyrophosphatase (MazG superfamily)
MLLNLSNHPVKNWREEQKKEAEKLYGEIKDLPFPKIDPHADEKEILEKAKLYEDEILAVIRSSNNKNNAVHIMGELTFTFALVKKLLENNIVCVASTTERNAIETEDGKKISEFRFIKFRKYVL